MEDVYSMELERSVEWWLTLGEDLWVLWKQWRCADNGCDNGERSDVRQTKFFQRGRRHFVQPLALLLCFFVLLLCCGAYVLQSLLREVKTFRLVDIFLFFFRTLSFQHGRGRTRHPGRGGRADHPVPCH